MNNSEGEDEGRQKESPEEQEPEMNSSLLAYRRWLGGLCVFWWTG